MNQSDNFDPCNFGRGAPQTRRGTGRAWTTIQERNRDHLHGWCDLAAGLRSVSGQWKASILIRLSEQESGLPDLQIRLELASRRVLVRALRELEAEGLVCRSVLTENAYALTGDGLSLVPILKQLASWNASRASAKG